MSFWNNFFASTPQITVSECQDKMNDKPGPILLDVRSTNEYRDGHIPGATSIPLDKLQDRMVKLSKRREIICICRSGRRSKQATRQLQAAGYTAVNMKGGMNAWQKADFSVKTGKVK